jgi:rubrerythrin
MPTTTAESALVENLRIAFQSEADAHARYVIYAGTAEAEGWHGVAALFRATAAAEEIHCSNHGRILHQLGGETDYGPAPVEPRSTVENLRTALASELFEIDCSYPAFLQHAREIRDVSVVRTLHWALEAEKTHARLVNEALTLMEFNDRDSWVTMSRPFFVCPVCGYTSAVENELPMCSVCNCSWKRFEVYQ